MFLKRLRDNRKSLLIWCLLLILMYAAVFLIYPSIMENTAGNINALLEAFPPELLDAFNMTDIATPAGWVTSEGMVMLLLCGAIYSAQLGGSCVYLEKKEGTIEFLAARPVTRSRILGSKALADILCITIFAVANSASLLIGLALSDDLRFSVMAQVTLSPILVFLMFYALTLLLSILFGGGSSLTLGLPFGLYILVILAKLTEKVEFLRYCTPYTLSDTAAILKNGGMRGWIWALGLALFLFLLGGSLWAYNRTESL
ncbi:MAG: ABC transporter permease subunit [Oscillospiraceae bacterium]|nr:ABC transporter permease subunit [Oscillospiraceae bacterium]